MPVDPPARDPPPRFRRERCLHDRHLAAGCVACIAVCDRDALRFDERGVRLDEDRCDGCGLCAAVCPEAAFEVSASVVLAEHKRRPAAFVACTRVRGAEEARVPCLRAIGLPDLARLHGEGVRLLVVAGTACDACPRHDGLPSLAENLDRLGRLLRSRGASVLRLEVLPPEQFERALAGAHRVDPRRRRLLRRVAVSREKGRVRPLYPWVPLFDPRRCEGCDACVRACPHGALELLRDREGAPIAYRVRAGRCTGCALCVDLCAREAITVVADRASPPPMRLRAARCPGCGVHFHEPSVHAEAALCRVCRKAGGDRRPSRVVE